MLLSAVSEVQYSMSPEGEMNVVFRLLLNRRTDREKISIIVSLYDLVI